MAQYTRKWSSVCDVHDTFGGSARATGVPCDVFEAVAQGRAPGSVGTTPSYHATGTQTNPTAGTVIADTGAMTAGVYEIVAHAGASDTAAAGAHILLEHRNAANAATLHRHLVPTPGEGSWKLPKLLISASERIRAITGVIASAAASVYVADLYARIVTDLTWTHVFEVPFATDVRDALTRLAGVNSLLWADGDEIRHPNSSGTRYVVVKVVAIQRLYKKVYAMRHSLDWTTSTEMIN